MSDSDSDVVVKKVRKPVKAAADDSDDDVPVVRKPAPKKAAASDSDDDTPVVRKPAVKKPAKKAADSDSDDDTPVVKKPVKKPSAKAVDSDSESDAPVRGRVHRDPAAMLDDDSDSDADVAVADLVDLIDYDSMTEDAFIAHLKSQSKAKRLEEKRQIAEAAATTSSNEDCHFDGTPAYSYQFMLERVLDICRQNNPELAQAERVKFPMPKIEKSGSKKTALTNFKQICKFVNRSQEEVKDYIEKTLTTTGAIDGNQCLILKYQGAKLSTFEKLFAKYVEEFVQCKACGRINTTLTKDASSRLLLMNCKDCKASRYIQVATGASFKAQTTKRSKMRNAIS
eukprot:CAMPEP_0174841314 /NCGR_PEP_ID=MMETSP1114-20130205/9228_1 /TAXON_ID=312471 /ORGANISM="Neobodo designis, Strain CCAP 1951/1" /LENGTH=339 /DNA_ID=CAMNT_0016075495 /DNA_START=33 /DNA_END=1052 /DNA_ORIENTATION=+